MPTSKQTLAIAFLAAAAVLAHAAEPAKKEPKTGKNCVAFVGSDPTDGAGKVRLYFRNICASPFQIQIKAEGRVREGAIEPGSPEKPTQVAITCKYDERCDRAKWEY